MITPNGRVKTSHPFPEVRLLDFQGAQAAANWTDSVSTGTPSKEDAPAYGLDSTNALRLVQENAGGTYRTRYNLYNAAGWDCSKSDLFTLVIEYPPGHLPSRHRVGSSGTIDITMSSDGSGLYTNNVVVTLGGGGAFCGITEPGRNVWSWSRADMTATLNINWAAVTNIRIGLNTASATDEVYIRGFWCGRRQNPVVCVVADDGWASQGLGANEMCTLANAQDVPMTLYVIPDLSDTSDGSTYLSTTEIAACAAAGNSIAVHGTGPAGNGSLLNFADSGLAQVTSQQAWVKGKGYDWQHYAYPGGAFNANVLNVMKSLGFKSARTVPGLSRALTAWAPATAYAVGTSRIPTAPGTNTLRYDVDSISGTGTSGAVEPTWPLVINATVVDNPGANQITWIARQDNYPSRISYYCMGSQVAGMPNWLSMNACPLNNQLTLAQVQTEVERAIKKGESIILYGHKLGGAADSLTFTTADFTSLMAYLARRKREGLIDCMTIPQMYAAFTSTVPTGIGARFEPG